MAAGAGRACYWPIPFPDRRPSVSGTAVRQPWRHNCSGQRLAEHGDSWFMMAPRSFEDPWEPKGCWEPIIPAHLYLSLFLIIGIVVSYLPQVRSSPLIVAPHRHQSGADPFCGQQIKIIKTRSSEGLSPWYLLLGALSSISNLLNVLILQAPMIECCYYVVSPPCLPPVPSHGSPHPRVNIAVGPKLLQSAWTVPNGLADPHVSPGVSTMQLCPLGSPTARPALPSFSYIFPTITNFSPIRPLPSAHQRVPGPAAHPHGSPPTGPMPGGPLGTLPATPPL